MIYKLLAVILLVTLVSGVPIEDFFPFNGTKVCLIDATTGLIHVSNTDDSGVPITNVSPSDCPEFRLSPNDDASSPIISLSIPFPFFNKRFRNVLVSAITKYVQRIII